MEIAAAVFQSPYSLTLLFSHSLGVFGFFFKVSLKCYFLTHTGFLVGFFVVVVSMY